MFRPITAIAFLFVVLPCTGCGDDCADADSKYSECNIDPAPTFQGICEAENLCVAECANASSCDDLEAAFDPDNKSIDNPYKKCTLGCYKTEPK